MKCLRKILSISYTARKTNASSKREIADKVGNQETLLSHIKKRKLQWLGCITRHVVELSLRIPSCSEEFQEKEVEGDLELTYSQIFKHRRIF